MFICATDQQYFDLRRIIEKGGFIECLVKDSKKEKEIIWKLVINKVPFHVVNYGAGVKRIIRNGSVCGHCLGRGYKKGGK